MEGIKTEAHYASMKVFRISRRDFLRCGLSHLCDVSLNESLPHKQKR